MSSAKPPAPETGPSLDDRLDALVGEYSDLVAAGRAPRPREFLERVPPEARAGLERCLKAIDAGLSSAPGASVQLAPGVSLGRYELRRELGRGGMAVVWLALDRELRRPVALKILRPGLALEARHVDRFRREAHAVARLKHPNVVQIHDVGSQQGFHYLAMEYVEGPSLARVIEALGGPAAGSQKDRRWTAEELGRASGIAALARRGRTLEQAIAALLAPVAEALEAAHELGIVHRDVKPSNILLRLDGTAVVADFGLAKSDGDPALSLTGDTLGTPYYMSPEQAWLAQVAVDHRTDIYSLGVVLYEALTLARPFEGASVLEVFDKIRTSLPPSLSSVEPHASRDAAAVARKAMARLPAGRYPGARALAADLVALSEARPTAARLAEGGALRRAWNTLRMSFSCAPAEYRSHGTFLGLPWVHVIRGPRTPGQPRRVAKGWFASCPELAIGGIACGGRAFGGLAFGGISGGLVFSWGGISLGGLASFGGIAAALFSFGGIAAGYLAMGGVALGYGAVGGVARGVYAMGGAAHGEHVITRERRDLTEDQFFDALLGFDVPVLRLFDKE